MTFSGGYLEINTGGTVNNARSLTTNGVSGGGLRHRGHAEQLRRRHPDRQRQLTNGYDPITPAATA